MPRAKGSPTEILPQHQRFIPHHGRSDDQSGKDQPAWMRDHVTRSKKNSRKPKCKARASTFSAARRKSRPVAHTSGRNLTEMRPCLGAQQCQARDETAPI